MNDEAPSPSSKRARRHGWRRTLLKCAALIAALALVGSGGLWWLVHHVGAPWFIPRIVFEWLVANVAPYALWVGAILGAIVGFVASLFVIAVDAARGRLSKLP